MGDGLKITNEKRHRSSSSLAGVLEGVRSEKRLDVRASIPEVDDQFAIAEARCDSLQDKIDLVKALKRKKKMKKKSMTTITEPVTNMENVPMITIRTRPKKKISQQAERFTLEAGKPSQPSYGYVDPDVIEQRRMLNRVHGYSEMNQQQHRPVKIKPNQDTVYTTQPKSMLHRDRADGDSEQEGVPPVLACGDESQYNNKIYSRPNVYYTQPKDNSDKYYYGSRPQSKQTADKRNRSSAKAPGAQTGSKINEKERRQVVELFKKSHHNEKLLRRPDLDVDITGEMTKQNYSSVQNRQEVVTGSMENITIKEKKPKLSRGGRRSWHYEQATVSSRLKRACRRCADGGRAALPFVVSKSSAPSHNVGVNLQQILNGVKLQQPLSKIPLTIAHHMGLRHVPSGGNRSAVTNPSSSSDGMNVIQLGRRLVRLPSFKAMSYGRLLALYRAGNPVVARFLSTLARPHYFYTSMYDLATNPEDYDAATSKGQGGSQAAKQSLAEYASLYREYEQVEKLLNENYDAKLEKRKENLAKKLTERENHIRKLVRDTGEELDAPGASLSADEDYRHSTFKLQTGT